MVKTLTLKINP